MDCVKDFTSRDVKPEEVELGPAEQNPNTGSPNVDPVCLSVQLLRVVPAEVPEDDAADLYEVPGVPHPAERGPGCQSRAAGPAPLSIMGDVVRRHAYVKMCCFVEIIYNKHEAPENLNLFL